MWPQFFRASVFSSTAHTLESARSPMYTTPSPIDTPLGPSARLRPLTSSSFVAKPEISRTLPLLVSTTLTEPMLIAGTQTYPVFGDVALKLAAEGSKHCNRRVEVRPFLADPA